MPIRLVALDLDGTLIETGVLLIAGEDADAIRSTVQRGVTVVLASARGAVGVTQFQRELGIRAPAICHNGAVAVDADGRELLHLRIDRGVAARIVRTILARDLYPTVVVDDVMYVRQRPDQSPGRLDFTRNFYRWSVEVVAEPSAVIDEAPTSIGLFHESAVGEVIEACAAEPVAALRYFAEGALNGVIFVHPAASKGNALRLIRDALGITREDVLAIGDSEADLSMFAEAGVSVAVANASDEVLARATWVAPSQHEQGVAAALERYVLERATR